jgi:hypothetical protein
VPFELHHAALLGPLEKNRVEFRFAEGKRYIHPRAILLRHRVPEEAARVEEVVKELRLLDVLLL